MQSGARSTWVLLSFSEKLFLTLFSPEFCGENCNNAICSSLKTPWQKWCFKNWNDTSPTSLLPCQLLATMVPLDPGGRNWDFLFHFEMKTFSIRHVVPCNNFESLGLSSCDPLSLAWERESIGLAK